MPNNAKPSANDVPHTVLSRLLLVLLVIIILSSAYLLGLAQGMHVSQTASYQAGYQAAGGSTAPSTTTATNPAPPANPRSVNGTVVSVSGSVVTISSLELARLTDPSATAPATAKVTVDQSTKITKQHLMTPAELQKANDDFNAQMKTYNALSPAERQKTQPPAPPTPMTFVDASLSDLSAGTQVTVTAADPLKGKDAFTATAVTVPAPALTGTQAPTPTTTAPAPATPAATAPATK